MQESDAADAFVQLGHAVNSGNVDGLTHVSLVDVVARKTETTLDILAVRVLGKGTGSSGSLNTSYGSNDHWKFAQQLYGPSCSCLSTPIAGQCADKKIQNRINMAINGGIYQYYTNIDTWIVDPYSFDDPANLMVGLLSHPSPVSTDNPIAGDGVRDYPVYKGYDVCLDPTDMRFYTQGVWDLMHWTRNNYVSTKYEISCTINGDLLMCGSCSDPMAHHVVYRFGKLALTQ